MSFLKTIQKRQSEMPTASDEIGNGPANSASNLVNQPPGLLSMPDLRIGAPQATAASVVAEAPARTDSVAKGGSRPKEIVPVDPASIREAPVVREISINVNEVNPRLVSITHPKSPYCEEYRNLRTQILHRSKKRKLQTIVIASVGPSEGKSVTALNLSWLFAQTDGVRALIIDSDLRRPSLSEYLGIDQEIGGLSEVLTGGRPLLSSIVKLQPAGLFLLPGGAARSDVAELISGPRFAEILKEARAHFDFIIIDAPPLGIFTDAALLINQSDGAMLVLRANHTRYKDVDRILDTLPRERMLGTILNQSETPLMDESYYRYGHYDRNEPLMA